ncbi:MAG: PD40 domain-containing protein [Candidatus Aenigmarchaeota archaeon]|nr:PD40 domain-containing protein [Candidatus Aenigmarchaeota archaeon]
MPLSTYEKRASSNLRRYLLPLFVPFLILSSPSVPASNGPEYGSPTDRIIYISNVDGKSDIWSMRYDGSDKRKVKPLNIGNNYYWPSVSPDGKRILSTGFDSQTFIRVYDRETQEEIRYRGPNFSSQQAWFPNSQDFVFISTRDGGKQQIYKMGPFGAERLVTSDGWDTSPAISPNGRWLAFVRKGVEAATGDVYVGGSDGRRIRQVTKSGDYYGATWSDDGHVLTSEIAGKGNICVVEVDVITGKKKSITTPESGCKIDINPIGKNGEIVFTRVDGYDKQIFMKDERGRLFKLTSRGDNEEVTMANK